MRKASHMKKTNNIKKIRKNYFIILLCLLGLAFICHTILSTSMRYQTSVSAEAKGIAKENRSTTYSVVFNANGGTSTMASQTIPYATSTSLNTNTLTRTGYTFNGWNTQANGSGTSYANQAVMNITNILENNTLNLYAKWQIIPYNITYTLNGGTQANPKTTYTVEDSFTLVNPTKTGYTFKGWSGTGLTGNTNTSVTITKGSTGNRSYTANWTVNTYKIKFNANGGSGTMSDLSMTYGTAKNLTSNSYTRLGYDFIGWNTKADGSGTTYTNGQSVNNLTTTNGATFNLYAIWKTAPGWINMKVGATGQQNILGARFSEDKMPEKIYINGDEQGTTSKSYNITRENSEVQLYYGSAILIDMNNMFFGCSSLTELDLSGMNTSNVVDMSGMFHGCSGLTELDLSGMDTSNVISMIRMFYGCSSLTTIYVSSSFVTEECVFSYNMFSGCYNLKGGAGTTYNSSYVDKTYARIDKPGTPGYFTDVNEK